MYVNMYVNIYHPILMLTRRSDEIHLQINNYCYIEIFDTFGHIWRINRDVQLLSSTARARAPQALALMVNFPISNL